MKVIFEHKGKQYEAEEGRTILIDYSPGEVASGLVFKRVLSAIDAKKIELGRPYIEGLKVKATIESQLKGKKVRVLKYKAKVNYHVTSGHRQNQTMIKIEKISKK